MSHLRLVPPPAPGATADAVADTMADTMAGTVPAVAPAQRAIPPAFGDANVVALSFFQAASGICLCRACSMKRHPAYGAQ